MKARRFEDASEGIFIEKLRAAGQLAHPLSPIALFKSFFTSLSIPAP
jgi:hypothetical protein